MRPVSILFLLFILVPPIEIGLFIAIGGRIGLWSTLGIVLLTAVIGANLVTRQGRGEIARLQSEFAAGRFPAKPPGVGSPERRGPRAPCISRLPSTICDMG